MAIGTFGTFTQARLGIYAATKGLTVTGNNISNINTVGYTRQALNQVSLRNGGADRYQGKYDLRIGNGALIKSISQLRDPYLDIRYRTEMSIVGQHNTTLSGLNSIADVIDEVGKGANDGDGVIFAQMSDFFSSLQQLNTDAAAQTSDTLARASADTLTNLFHFYANKLEELQSNTAGQLKQEVAGLNGILTSIRELNSAIRKSEIHGDPALEMRDERNNLIDQLSQYLKIDVTYTMEDVGAGQQVEKLTIKLGNANPDPASTSDSTVLVDGVYARQFDLPDSFPKENEAYSLGTHTPDDPDNLDPVKDLPMFKYLKADGAGTNDPAEAERVPNSNYDMTLGKLLDAKGREWSNILSSSVNKMNPPPEGAPTKAVYAFTLDGDLQWSTDPDNPSTIVIDGSEYTIGATGDHYIVPGIAGSPNRLASFIANELRKGETYSEYDVTTDGPTIIFTAKNPGAVGQLTDEDGNPLVDDDGNPVMGSGPAEAVNLTLTNGGDNLTLTPDLSRTAAGTEFDPEKFQNASITTNPDGTKTFTTYAMKGTDWYKTEVVSEYSQIVELDDNDLYGSIQAFRELLTEAGEFSTSDTVQNVDENALAKRGIPYYRYSLDLLARVFATAFNEANNGYAVDQNGNYLTEAGETIELAGKPVSNGGLTQEQKDALIADGCVVVQRDANGDPIRDAGGNEIPVLDEDGNQLPDLERFLDAKGVEHMGGNLFSCRGDLDDGEGITAANISVSHRWSIGDVHIVNSFTKLFGGDVKDTTQESNIGHMISLMGKSLVYDPSSLVDGADSVSLFKGSFQDMLISMSSVLGNDQREISGQLDTALTYAVEMDTNRDSVSAVDLNDEAMNLMQYAKSLNAAYRLMTTLDEALDRLINNTGIVGR